LNVDDITMHLFMYLLSFDKDEILKFFIILIITNRKKKLIDEMNVPVNHVIPL